MNKIIQAAQLAERLHYGQKRKYSGQPYIVHPIRVAQRAIMLPYATEELVCAAYLHDTIEDCDITHNELDMLFGGWVAHYVRELTNPSKKHPELNRDERKKMDIEHLKKTYRECRVIKLLDRIDNLNDIPWDESFAPIYFKESELLLESLKNTDRFLEEELQATIQTFKTYKEINRG